MHLLLAMASALAMFTFGKHSGRTFGEVAVLDRGYCMWVLQKAEAALLCEFAQFLRHTRGGMLSFGRHCGLWYTEVIDEYPEWCNWAVAQPDPSPQLADFVSFVCESSQSVKSKCSTALASVLEKSSKPDSALDRKTRHCVPIARRRKGVPQAKPRARKATAKTRLVKEKNKNPANQVKNKRLHSKEKAIKIKKGAACEGKVNLRLEAESKQSAPAVCVICLDASINTVFVPCGHMCACAACVINLQKTTKVCPICRERFKEVVRTYTS